MIPTDLSDVVSRKRWDPTNPNDAQQSTSTADMKNKESRESFDLAEKPRRHRARDSARINPLLAASGRVASPPTIRSPRCNCVSVLIWLGNRWAIRGEPSEPANPGLQDHTKTATTIGVGGPPVNFHEDRGVR
ncbi:hypothetical protein G5I_10621 [Acromyrmex echinatior]|uniref:Uncharacterized protein n=1 Tax=Acromyrmex echinatior TaxID=103372 RepID=F4WXD7_ACREC|nr:hypothetical protein G5I_10621 [Acromyrmex echinatior]